MPMQMGNIGEALPEGVSIEIEKAWMGDVNSLVDPFPADQPAITLSKKKLLEFGVEDKINFVLKYDFSKLGYGASALVAIAFDQQSPLEFVTNLRGLHGAGKMVVRERFLPKADNQKPVGEHTLELKVYLKPRWNVWTFSDNYMDIQQLPHVASFTKTIKVTLTE